MARPPANVARVLRFGGSPWIGPFPMPSTPTRTSPLAFIFDVDGTLVDSVDLHALSWQRVLAQWGHQVELADVRNQIGKGGDQLMPVFLSEAEVEHDGEAIEAARSRMFKEEYLHQVQPFPGVADLFRRLIDRGQPIALGSSGKPEELDHYKRLTGIAGLELEQTTSDDAARSKPHPDIFQAALERLRLPGRSVVAVGDSPYDASAALKAGITPVGVLCGGFAPAQLSGAGCVRLFDGPEHMLRACDEEPLA